MRRCVLVRDATGPHGTFGTLAMDGARLHTLEPPWKENIPNLSCIPHGEYLVRPHRSPRFGRCLCVTAVPDRTHILIHAGNLGGDTESGYRSHTLGCILPGMRRGRLPAQGRVQAAVLASRPAVRRLMAWAADRPFTLEICNA